MPSGSRRRPPGPRGLRRLDNASDADLLDTKLSDLDITLESSWLSERVAQLFEQLSARRIRVRPHLWLSDEWMTPDHCIGIGVPFYLAHPRLIRLERRQMREAEGDSPRTAMRLLRHEMGHVVCNAYQLHRRASWRSVFGSPALPYPKVYHPDPTSKSYVQHLDNWYAQCHPDEDWAETFAVWLSPRRTWLERYRGWPALRKLLYVDGLMNELMGQPPRLRSRAQPYALRDLKLTLGEHYALKRERYGMNFPVGLEPQLTRIFTRSSPGGCAARFVRAQRPRILGRSRAAGAPLLEWALHATATRCQELGLRVSGCPTRRARECTDLVVACAQKSRAARGYFAV
jgi:hypothetical protein